MHSFRSLIAFVSSSVLFAGASAIAGGDSWQPLMERTPSDANVLVMIDAEKIRNSGFARATGWNAASSAPGGLRSLLPRNEIKRALLAARLNLVDLSPQWEAGLFETNSDASLDLFAAGISGPHEQLGSTPGVRLPIDAYLLKLAPSTFGMLGPADRQKAAKWARASASAQSGNSASLDSAYLMKIASFPETIGTEVMLGVDLTDAADVAVVKKALSESPVLRDAKIDAAAAAEIISSIEGVAIGVRVLDEATGMIRVDFTRDPSLLKPVLKPLLLERLAARGAMIEDFRSWTPDLQGNTAFLGGKLSPEGLNFVLSLIEPELPAPAASTVAATATPPSLPTTSASPSAERTSSVMVEKSKQHFTKVKQLITEVRFPSSDLKIVSSGAFGAWIDRQARRIDQLPLLDVDPELLDYSQGVAKSLRVTAAKQRGATINASASSSRRYRYHDGYQSYVSDSENQIQTRMEDAAANLSHVEVMRMLDDETAEMRRRLTERYHVEF